MGSCWMCCAYFILYNRRSCDGLLLVMLEIMNNEYDISSAEDDDKRLMISPVPSSRLSEINFRSPLLNCITLFSISWFILDLYLITNNLVFIFVIIFIFFIFADGDDSASEDYSYRAYQMTRQESAASHARPASATSTTSTSSPSTAISPNGTGIASFRKTKN